MLQFTEKMNQLKVTLLKEEKELKILSNYETRANNNNNSRSRV